MENEILNLNVKLFHNPDTNDVRMEIDRDTISVNYLQILASLFVAHASKEGYERALEVIIEEAMRAKPVS